MDLFGWSILLLGLGLVFLVLEFFIPSAGTLGVLAGLSFVGAIVLAFLEGPIHGVGVSITVMLIVPAALLAAVNWWPETPIGRLILIKRPDAPEEVLPETEGYRGLKLLVGKRGQAKSLMLPSGSVQIEHRTYDALSEGIAIEPGQPIVVVGVSMQRLVVRSDDSPLRAELADSFEAASPLAQEVPDPFAE